MKRCIISYSCKNPNIPISRADFLAVYRKKNASVRHEYYALANAHLDLQKSMLTFTVSGRGTYSKLRLINEIKSYVTYLIANSSAEIYFFSNIELGHSFTNPHLHTQVWCDDLNAVRSIYERVIDKFGLDVKRCEFSLPNKDIDVYHYVLKDYSPFLTDDRVLEIEKVKKKYRKQLGLRLRFYSRSKSKYQKRLYRIAYWSYGVLRAHADSFLDILTLLFRNKERFFKELISSFISIENKCNEEKLMPFFAAFFDVLSFSSSMDPPYFYIDDAKNLIRKCFMIYYLCFYLACAVDVVGRGPPAFGLGRFG